MYGININTNGQLLESIQSELHNTGQVRMRGLDDNGNNATTKRSTSSGCGENGSNIEHNNSADTTDHSSKLDDALPV